MCFGDSDCVTCGWWTKNFNNMAKNDTIESKYHNIEKMRKAVWDLKKGLKDHFAQTRDWSFQ